MSGGDTIAKLMIIRYILPVSSEWYDHYARPVAGKSISAVKVISLTA